MKIDIEHIAKLSKLKIADEKKAKFEKDMEGIIGMIESLPKEVSADTSLNALNNMELRQDAPKDEANRLSRKELLANAPHIQAGCFAVPKIVE